MAFTNIKIDTDTLPQATALEMQDHDPVGHHFCAYIPYILGVVDSPDFRTNGEICLQIPTFVDRSNCWTGQCPGLDAIQGKSLCPARTGYCLSFRPGVSQNSAVAVQPCAAYGGYVRAAATQVWIGLSEVFHSGGVQR